MNRVTELGDKLRFLEKSPYAQEICGHRGNQLSLCNTADVKRSTLRDNAKKSAINPDAERDLANNFAFEVAWPEWRTGTRQQFEARYNKQYDEAAARVAAKAKVAAYRAALQPRNAGQALRVSRSGSVVPVDDFLATMQLGANQVGEGEPVPLTLELVCHPTPMGPDMVAVKRGKLKVNCENAMTTPIDRRLGGAEPYKHPTSPITIIASGADDRRPVWRIEAEQGPIGVLILRDGICELLNLAPDSVVIAEFQVYIKDLETVVKTKSRTAACDEQPHRSDTYSFVSDDGDDIGGRAKKAILDHMAMLELFRERGWISLCGDQLTFEKIDDETRNT